MTLKEDHKKVNSTTPIILAIETAGLACSVCLARGENPIGQKIESTAYQHSKILAPFVKELLDEHQLQVGDLGGLIINKGPGSYTGLRVGFAFAKSLAFSCGIPMVGISGLEALAWQAAKNKKFDLCIPMLDARRMEVYMAVYNHQLEALEDPRPLVLDESFFLREDFTDRKVVLTGNGTAKLSAFNLPPNFEIYPGDPEAIHLLDPGIRAFREKNYENIRYFEPMYLKEARITSSRKTLS